MGILFVHAQRLFLLDSHISSPVPHSIHTEDSVKEDIPQVKSCPVLIFAFLFWKEICVHIHEIHIHLKYIHAAGFLNKSPEQSLSANNFVCHLKEGWKCHLVLLTDCFSELLEKMVTFCIKCSKGQTVHSSSSWVLKH